MLEDDLRHFPMATTGYLQKVRGSKRVQDFIRMHALFNAPVQRLDPWESRGIFSSNGVDWLGYQVHEKAVDLSNPWGDSFGARIESCPYTRINEWLRNAVCPLVSLKFTGFLRLTGCIEFQANSRRLMVCKNHLRRLPPADTKLTGSLFRIWSISGLQYSG